MLDITNVSGKSYNITPNDTVEQHFSALWIGTAGNVALMNQDGTVVTFYNYPVQWLPAAGRMLLASGTTASQITAAI